MTRREAVEVIVAVVLGFVIGWLGLAALLHPSIHHLVGA
ncbi:hypothetical protein ATL42_1527 [Sanguibacter antarcticus]|uniref:Uncharacterized protein n=1 Tax=Sanguibacter antarcticus TaxID=372484 RepID=A0A2A9E469_9MICO|nr:hypothetical protein ATL42_1527 [Sanguibacter antarcticus]